MDSDKEEKIRRRAYEIWEAEGKPEGREQEHWERAAREIEQETSETGGGSTEPPEEAGLSSGLQPGGTLPGASPANGEGSIGTGGGSTKGRRTGTAKRAKK